MTSFPQVNQSQRLAVLPGSIVDVAANFLISDLGCGSAFQRTISLSPSTSLVLVDSSVLPVSVRPTAGSSEARLETTTFNVSLVRAGSIGAAPTATNGDSLRIDRATLSGLLFQIPTRALALPDCAGQGFVTAAVESAQLNISAPSPLALHSPSAYMVAAPTVPTCSELGTSPCSGAGTCSLMASAVSSSQWPVCECTAPAWGVRCASSRSSTAPSTCLNGVRDASESDIDCGGNSGCGPCAAGQMCSSDADCSSSIAPKCVASPVNSTQRVCSSTTEQSWARDTPIWRVMLRLQSAGPAGTLRRRFSEQAPAGGATVASALLSALSQALRSVGAIRADLPASATAIQVVSAASGAEASQLRLRALLRSSAVTAAGPLPVRLLLGTGMGGYSGSGVEVAIAVRRSDVGDAASVTSAVTGGALHRSFIAALPEAGVVSAVLVAPVTSATAGAGGSSPQQPPPGGPDGVIAGVFLLVGVIVAAIITLVFIECTSEKDAFGRGPMEQAAAANCLCLDRSLRRLNRGTNGQFSSAVSASGTSQKVPRTPPAPVVRPLAAAPAAASAAGAEASGTRRVPNPLGHQSAEVAEKAAQASRAARKNRPKSFSETVNPLSELETEI